MAIKERKAKIDKKTGQISTVKIPLLPITWYLQFLKRLVDLEQAKIKLRVNRKLLGGQGGRQKTNYVDVSIKIDKKAFADIDLNFFKFAVRFSMTGATDGRQYGRVWIPPGPQGPLGGPRAQICVHT